MKKPNREYNWVDTYEKIANKILCFKDNREQLLDDVGKLLTEKEFKDRKEKTAKGLI